MKTVVITGSARGFGYAMLELFRKRDFNVVLCDINEESLKFAESKLEIVKGDGRIFKYKVDITKEDEVTYLINDLLTHVETIDIWINNAGVNQPNKPIWELDKNTIDRLIEIDLKGTILCSKLIMKIGRAHV